MTVASSLRATRLLLAAIVASAALASPACAGTWRHEYVSNDGNVLTYSEGGKTIFYIGCGRGFAITSNIRRQQSRKAMPTSRSRRRAAA